MKRRTLALLIISTFLLTSCHLKGKHDMEHLTSSTPQSEKTSNLLDVWTDADGREYPIYRNPNPKEKYDFVITPMKGVPDNLKLTKIYVQYNSGCQSIVSRSAGAYAKITHTISTTTDFKKIDGVYHMDVYKDYLLDLDMLHEGKTCKWEIEAVVAYFEPEPNIARERYYAMLNINKFHQVADKTWAEDLRMTLWRYNENKTGDTEISETSLNLNKSAFGPAQQKELVNFRIELKGK